MYRIVKVLNNNGLLIMDEAKRENKQKIKGDTVFSCVKNFRYFM